MLGPESRCARTREVRRLAGEASGGCLGFEGSRPRRPFRLSVRTTAEKQAGGEEGTQRSLCTPMLGSTPESRSRAPESQQTRQGPPRSKPGRWTGDGVEIRSRHGLPCSPRAQMSGGLCLPHPPQACLSLPAGPSHPPSFTMPTARHFWKRQNWQRFRRLLSTGQSLLARQMYLAFFCTVRWGGRHGTGCQRVGWGGGSPGEGTVQILLPSQTKALSVHSYFSNIWVAGEGEMKGWGEEQESLGDIGGGFCLQRKTLRM